ncbi:MAG: methylaspartate mutase [Helicobacteraceae bacterium 4484_230]|nr:MAG: methylaspartate mutase [Helicobacteraceae bacterium 4484_230]
MKKPNKLLIDIGSTYFKICENGHISHYFRNFDKNIFDDLTGKCSETLKKYAKEDIHICSSANGGLSTLIIGLTNSFSLKYAINIAFNSGINIIDTVHYLEIEKFTPPKEMIDVVIVVGGIDGGKGVFDERLPNYLKEVNYQNIVYVGNNTNRSFLQEQVPGIKILDNIISSRLQMHEEELKTYLTDLYQADIMGKEDIKHFYDITSNQIYSTPYIVNRSLPHLSDKMNVADPFILIDIGGATTDIHYSRDLVKDNIITDSEYDRLVFKKLGVYKSRESLVFSAKNNEFVYELLNFLNVTENILEERSDKATKVLMQLSIFLVLYKMSKHHKAYIELELEKLNSIVLTGGITKVLSFDEINEIILFFYKKILHFHHAPAILLDSNYEIWSYGMVTPKEQP